MVATSVFSAVATVAGVVTVAGATGARAGPTGATASVLPGQSAVVTVFGVPVVAILLEQVMLGVGL